MPNSYSTYKNRSVPLLTDTTISSPVNDELLTHFNGLWINQTGKGIKVYTTTERDALTPYTGQVIYNTTDNVLQVYNGGWTNV